MNQNTTEITYLYFKHCRYQSLITSAGNQGVSLRLARGGGWGAGFRACRCSSCSIQLRFLALSTYFLVLPLSSVTSREHSTDTRRGQEGQIDPSFSLKTLGGHGIMRILLQAEWRSAMYQLCPCDCLVSTWCSIVLISRTEQPSIDVTGVVLNF